MAEVRSNKGRLVDMDKLRKQNEKSVAVGNAKMNARGDKLGKGGKIQKTTKERTVPYYNNNPKAVKQIGIKSLTDDDKENTEIDTVGKADDSISEKKEKTPPKKTARKSSTKSKTIDKAKERELEDGSIIIEDDEDSKDES